MLCILYLSSSPGLARMEKSTIRNRKKSKEEMQRQAIQRGEKSARM